MLRTKFLDIVKYLPNISFLNNLSKNICLSAIRSRDVVDKKLMLRSLPATDEGTIGEKAIDLDSAYRKKSGNFPGIDTPNQLFNGIPFKDVPIFNIKVSKNNAIISLTDSKGVIKLIRSCGVEGFKHTKKGTNVAAQATAVTIGSQALERGLKTVRVRVRGLGPGRMSAIKGLQLSGLEIISITDYTKVTWNPLRPRKQRRL